MRLRAHLVKIRKRFNLRRRRAFICVGAENLIDEIDENYLGTRMYWSHYDTETYLKMLKECGFAIIWSKYVKDSTCEGAGHLFALVQKKM